jgi:hypothetical protein
MHDSSRAQGGLICLAAVAAGALFLLGLGRHSYWALAIPVAVAVFFALGLTFWVGWTIATIRVEPEAGAESAGPDSEAEAAPDTNR